VKKVVERILEEQVLKNNTLLESRPKTDVTILTIFSPKKIAEKYTGIGW
jgi:hypothetical protein